MIQHIRETSDGFINTISGLIFFSISMTTINTIVGTISGLCAACASIAATVYYVKAIKNGKK